MDSPPRSSVHGIFQVLKSTGVGCHFLLQDRIPKPALPNWTTTWTLSLGMRAKASAPLTTPMETHKQVWKFINPQLLPPSVSIKKMEKSQFACRKLLKAASGMSSTKPHVQCMAGRTQWQSSFLQEQGGDEVTIYRTGLSNYQGNQ